MTIRNGILAAFLLYSFTLTPADALGEVELEYHKTVILFKILQFVTFSESGEEVLELICFGEDAMTRAISTLSRTYQVSGKKIHVSQVRSFQELLGINRIHIVFLAADEIMHLAEIQEEARKRSFLLVGDGEGFAARGVHVNLILFKGRIQFEINRLEVEKTDLYLSSKLYKLARIIE
jgi:hypothetical protein